MSKKEHKKSIQEKVIEWIKKIFIALIDHYLIALPIIIIGGIVRIFFQFFKNLVCNRIYPYLMNTTISYSLFKIALIHIFVLLFALLLLFIFKYIRLRQSTVVVENYHFRKAQKKDNNKFYQICPKCKQKLEVPPLTSGVDSTYHCKKCNKEYPAAPMSVISRLKY